MTFRGNGTLVSRNTAYIPSSLMPGYCGHIPTTKFLYGETFANSTLKYFQNIRSATMASSKNPYNKGSVPLSSHTQDSRAILPYWIRYNIDFKRQKEIKDFIVTEAQGIGYYKDKTGTVQPRLRRSLQSQCKKCTLLNHIVNDFHIVMAKSKEEQVMTF
uniref:Ciliary microtubule inner protein 2C n=1 Tax=Sinocyclocheilus anshuiensis TaxID=1608454 RepID=A0A671NEK8_9TELE